MTQEQPMFTTDLVNLYNSNIFKTSLYIYIFQDEKCRLMRNLSLSMVLTFILEIIECRRIQTSIESESCYALSSFKNCVSPF